MPTKAEAMRTASRKKVESEKAGACTIEEEAKKPKREKKKPVFLFDNEQQELLDQPNPRWPTGRRNLMILKFFLFTGTRVSELCALKWNYMNLNTGLIQIIDGKGGKDRSVYADPELLDDLRSWRAQQEKDIGPADHVFTTLQGGPVSPRYIQQMVARYRNRAGIEKHVTPHKLRHTYASGLFRETHNIILVQQMLGHEDVSTTMIYTHLEDSQVREEIAKAAAARRAKMQQSK